MKSEYITPSVTLFKEDGSLDLASQEKHYQRLIDAEISGILILGSIGESRWRPQSCSSRSPGRCAN